MKASKIVLVLCVFILSCKYSDSFDADRAKEEILKLHNAQRGFHFEKDSMAFVNQLSTDFISVNRGVITSPSRGETLHRYNSYFSSVEFTKWDDMAEPIIRFSSDGSLGYTIVDKIVEVEYVSENGEIASGTTHFAWVSIYRKTEEGWKIESVASTNKPTP